MTSQSPLVGLELIDCAKANSNQEIKVAARLCGYGEEVATFESELQKAGEDMGIKIHSFYDLSDTPDESKEREIIIAPESTTQL
jgi:hypothetical protein